MEHRLCILLAVCALSAAAVVPRRRRGGTGEDDETTRFAVMTEITTGKDMTDVICDETTPCAWVIYYPGTEREQMTIMNTYCVCDEKRNSECWISEEGSYGDWFAYKCMPPSQERASGN